MSSLRLPADAATLPPKDVARLVAEDLAARLPGEWTVTPHGLRQTGPEQTTELELHRSTYSRAGRLFLDPRLTVLDARLGQSRRTPGKRVTRADSTLFTSLTSNLGSISSVGLVTADAPEEYAGPGTDYDDFVHELMSVILPTRELLRSPGAAAGLPDVWLYEVYPLALWALAVGQPEVCWLLADRAVHLLPQFRDLTWAEANFREQWAAAISGSVATDLEDEFGVDDDELLVRLLAANADRIGPPPAWLTQT